MNCRCFHAQQVVDNDDQPKKKPIEVSHYYNDMFHSLATQPHSTVSESQHIIHRQVGKEKKMENRKKRALKTAYQENPKVFDMEPAELHSDADGEEDAMV